MFDKNIEVVNDRYETVYHHLSVSNIVFLKAKLSVCL